LDPLGPKVPTCSSSAANLPIGPTCEPSPGARVEGFPGAAGESQRSHLGSDRTRLRRACAGTVTRLRSLGWSPRALSRHSTSTYSRNPLSAEIEDPLTSSQSWESSSPTTQESPKRAERYRPMPRRHFSASTLSTGGANTRHRPDAIHFRTVRGPCRSVGRGTRRTHREPGRRLRRRRPSNRVANP